MDPWQSVLLEEEREGPGAGLPEAVLLGGHVVQGGQPPAYLTQEVWVPVGPTCQLSHAQIAAVMTTGPWAAPGVGVAPLHLPRKHTELWAQPSFGL